MPSDFDRYEAGEAGSRYDLASAYLKLDSTDKLFIVMIAMLYFAVAIFLVMMTLHDRKNPREPATIGRR